MQSEMTWHRPRGSLVCLVLALYAASTSATLREPAVNLTSDDIYRDCSDLPSYMPSGVYTLRPGMEALDVQAYCDMDRDGGGWTVVIHRDDIEPRVDFSRDWDAYKWGIGSLEGEFYWGNEFLWMLTSHLDREYEVHIWLEDFSGYTRYALYQNFVVESEAAHYRLLVGEYSGTAGDSLYKNSNMSFTTYDREYATYAGENCAVRAEAGWWFYGCSRCQLTGRFYEGGYTENYNYHGILWWEWKNGDPWSLKAAVMKIKPSKKL